MIVASPEARALLSGIEAVIFDIDGVLLDVSRSIRAVNCLSIPTYLRTLPDWAAPDTLLHSDEIERFKEAGGFNDDWDLTFAAVLLYLYKAAHYRTRDAAVLHTLSPTIEEYTSVIAACGGWLHTAEAYLQERATAEEWAAVQTDYRKDLIRRLYQELWAGDNCQRLYGFAPAYFPGPGKIAQDRPLVDVALVPTNRIVAALTGRTRAEAEFGLEVAGLADRIPQPDFCMTKDDGNAKPDPSGLVRLMATLGCRTAVYIGDTVDDLRTVLHYRALPESEGIAVLSAQVLTGTVGPDAPALFADADILASDVNDVLRLLAPTG